MNLRCSRSILLLLPLLLGACNSLQPQPPAPKTETISGTALKGTYITALNERGQSLKFQIRDVELDSKDKEREVYLYTLFYQDPATAAWKNLCPPDREGVAKAVVLTGQWDERGNHVKGDDRTMFACTNGVAAKCVRLEYKPWKVLKGQSLWKYHQACTRMLRADYCGDGLPHTREGTPIEIHDRLIHNPQEPDQTPPDPRMSFEAAWDENGAVYVNRPRWSEKTAAIQRKCPKKFQSGKGIRTVEQAQKQYPQALIFNESIDRQPK